MQGAGSSLSLGALHAGLERPRALDKARALPADALILDLEDAVAPAPKRRAPASWSPRPCEAGGYGGAQAAGPRQRARTPIGARTISPRACAAGPDAILMPKVETAADVDRGGRALLERHGAPGRMPALGDDGDAARRC